MPLKHEKLVQEDLNVGTGAVWISAPGRGKLRSTQIGIHSVARGQKSYTATWAPGAIAAGASTSTTVTVTDAVAGDMVMASHTAVSQDLMIRGHVSAADTVKVEVYNPTSASITVASGTVAVLVFEMAEVAVETSTVSGNVTVDGGPGIWEGGSVYMTVDGDAWAGGPATTDSNGDYSFSDVPAGAIVVSISGNPPSLGYREGSNSGTTVPPDPLTLDIDAVGA